MLCRTQRCDACTKYLNSVTLFLNTVCTSFFSLPAINIIANVKPLIVLLLSHVNVADVRWKWHKYRVD